MRIAAHPAGYHNDYQFILKGFGEFVFVVLHVLLIVDLLKRILLRLEASLVIAIYLGLLAVPNVHCKPEKPGGSISNDRQNYAPEQAHLN